MGGLHRDGPSREGCPIRLGDDKSTTKGNSLNLKKGIYHEPRAKITIVIYQQ